jgi:hypothetical protein
LRGRHNVLATNTCSVVTRLDLIKRPHIEANDFEDSSTIERGFLASSIRIAVNVDPNDSRRIAAFGVRGHLAVTLEQPCTTFLATMIVMIPGLVIYAAFLRLPRSESLADALAR